MNTKKVLISRPGFARLLSSLVFAAAIVGSTVDINAQNTATGYFWMAPRGADYLPRESFVFQTDGNTAADIRTRLAQHQLVGISAHIAPGAVAYNKDYLSPDKHVWSWHVESVIGVFDFDNAVFPECQCPTYIANPSAIDKDPQQWIADNGDLYRPKYYVIYGEIDPSKPDAVANVSNRGWTGSGEKALITGFIITGGQPRSVVVRALGPSLAGHGVQQPAQNPKLELYNASGDQLTGNADWQTDIRAAALSQYYPSLVPSDVREAARLVTLLPGAYTLHGLNEDGAEGVILLEMYDVDANP